MHNNRMRLSEILGSEVPPDSATGLYEADPWIDSLASDSRRVTAGSLFFAIDGVKQNGADFIPDAIKNGAVAIVVKNNQDFAADAQWIPTAEPRQLLAAAAARFYPIKPKVIVAVTGTNGKTSVANFCQQIWEGLGLKAASIGTLGLKKTSQQLPNPGLTTPDTISLHRILQELAGEGYDHVAIEASSHGLDQYRLDGIPLTAAGFTNLTQDHLDYHQTMENYSLAKSRLFGSLISNRAVAVLNYNDPLHQRLAKICKDRGIKTVNYGRIVAACDDDLVIADHKYLGNHQEVVVRHNHCDTKIIVPFIAEFQLYNLLCAIGMVASAEFSLQMIAEAINSKGLRNIPGRVERIGSKDQTKNIYIDYAHTPDGLKSILVTLQQSIKNSGRVGSVIVVFGCGGDRDRSKRPIMGKIAAELANIAIITDDNPRSEVPKNIRAEIIQGIKDDSAKRTGGFKSYEIGDRSSAIKFAIEMAKENDIVLIAGKGHENGQIVGSQVLEFNDEVEAKRWLNNL